MRQFWQHWFHMQIVSWTKAEIRDTIIFTLQSPKTTLSTHKTRRFCMTTTTPLSEFPISLKTTMEDWTNFGYHFSGELILLFVNRVWMWFHVLTLAWNVKCMNDTLPHLLWFWVKNLSVSVWFYVKLLKLHELGVSGSSWHRTEVKREFSMNVNSCSSFMLWTPTYTKFT